MRINGETKVIGFLGTTYKTSKMYALYNAAFAELNLNFIYIPLIVTNLAEAVKGIRGLGLHAVGVTIPYKIAIIPFLDELDNDAQRIGAVNIVTNHNGKLIGGNTDGKGGIKALQEVTEISKKNIVLLGAGGVAHALAFALKDAGANVIILNRTEEHAKNLAEKVACRYGSFTNLSQELSHADIIIQATTVGMYSENDSVVPITEIPEKRIVMDVIAKPRETKFIRDAQVKGCKIVYGERMLFWQAVLKFSQYTGVEPPIDIMERVLMQKE